MPWTTFECPQPDFFVRSIPDDVQFGVLRSCLGQSEVFRDMFACCELGFDLSSEDNDPEVNQTLDLLESASTLSLLLHLLHNPLESPTYEDEPSLPTAGKPARRTLSAIPFPLLPQLLLLADKYILRESIPATLLLHLEAHAATHPLHVYGLAISHGLPHLANKTTAFLLSPSLHTYTPEAIAVIPSVKAYHRLVKLHAYRVESLRKLVKAEEVFPHGYGACAAHLEKTNLWWSQAQDTVAPLIEAGTDVAAEMAGILDKVKKCPICHKACTAAVDMLAYKCRKVPKTVDKVPDAWPLVTA